MKKISYLAILVIAFVATSCLGSSDSKIELERNLTSTHNFSVVQRIEDQAQYMVDRGPDYHLEVSLTEQTVSLAVSNLRYWTDQSVASFKVQDVPFKYDNNGAIVVDVPVIEESGVKITNLKLSYLERTDGEISLPAWDITYTVNDNYMVRAVQDIVALFGKAEVTTIETSNVYTTDAPYYQLFFDPMSLKDGDKVEGYMTIYGASFSDGMPEMNLKYYFTATINISGFSINASSVKVYTLDGNNEIEQPEFEFTSFSAGGLFSLTSTYEYPYYFDFTVGERYMVGLDLGYSIPQSWARPDEVL